MVPEGWQVQKLGRWLVEHREKSAVQDQYVVLTSSRAGLVRQDNYYGEGRLTKRLNVGFHAIPPNFFTYRSRSDDGLFFFNKNKTGAHGIVSHFYPVFYFPKGDGDFFHHMLNYYRHKIGTHSVGSSQRVLSLNALRDVALPIPPLPEQNKIAAILVTWDKAIETTEKLLANAEAQKRALMQQLLTGRRRLKGFEDEWRKMQLRDIAKVIVSNVDKKSAANELPVRLCNYTDVYKRDFILPTQTFMEATATAEQLRKFRLKVGDVVITKDSETADDIATPTYVAATADDLICGYHLAIIRPGKEADGRYLKFFFELPHTRHYFGTRANGAIRYGLTIDGIEGAEIRLPGVDEQKRIAAVLVAAERAISDHEDAIRLLKTAKTSLMQQLLTGKRRVKV